MTQLLRFLINQILVLGPMMSFAALGGQIVIINVVDFLRQVSFFTFYALNMYFKPKGKY